MVGKTYGLSSESVDRGRLVTFHLKSGIIFHLLLVATAWFLGLIYFVAFVWLQMKVLISEDNSGKP